MFTKSKISQSMLDAVNSVIAEEDKKLLLEPEKKSTKIDTPTGTKVLGHRYGNSAKAHKDQTSHEIDKIKGPKEKEMKEEVDTSFQQKLVERAKMKMTKEGKGNGPQETFTDNNMGEEKHVETMHKSPSKGTDIADKSYLKTAGKKPTVKGDLKNLGRFLTGKKETNESVEVTSGKSDEVTTDMIKGREKGGNSNEFKPYKLQLKIDGEMKAPEAKEPEETEARKSIKAKEPKVDLPNLVPEEKNWIAGAIKKPGAETAAAHRAGMSTQAYAEKHKHDSGKAGKRARLAMTLAKIHKEEAELDQQINEVLSKDASAGDWIHDFVHSDNPKFEGKSKKKRKEMALAAYYSKKNEEVELDEADTKNTDLEHRQDMRRKEGMTLHLQQMGKNPKQIEKLMKKMKMPHSEETVVEGRMKDIATDKAEDERLGTWKKETPWMDSKETVTDKSGAKHTPMSRAKDLARSAFKKLQKETMMGKISN